VPAYRTIAAAVSTEIPAIKKSRFVADAAPVSSEAEALAFIAAIQKEHDDARHHCFAWRLQAGDAGWRVSDAGEPGGTAGMPILARIDGQDLRGLVVVVTRWFGGTKLGKGGLIRAYGGAAAAVLEAAVVVEVRETVAVQIRFAYGDQGAVDAVLRAMELVPTAADYGEAVVISVAVPTEEQAALAEQLRDGTAGRVGVTRG
jgi:uncharacterized YigZ family protein